MRTPTSITPPNPGEGFTVVELIVALTVFALVSSGLAATLAASISLQDQTQQRDFARESARGLIGQMRAFDDFTSVPAVFDGERFEVEGLTHPVDGGPAAVVEVDDTNQDLYVVRVTVDWTSRHGAETVVLETRLADVHPW